MLFENVYSTARHKPSFRVVRLRDVNVLGRSEKVRVIHMPNYAMRLVHKRLLAFLRSRDFAKTFNMQYASACRPGNSVFAHVKKHRFYRYFYLTDLHHAYASVDGRRLADVLCMSSVLHGQQTEVYRMLRDYCLSEKGGLATGAPCSPDLFNIYCAVVLDPQLAEICKKHRIRYSRYLDDLVFSSFEKIGKHKRKQIRQCIEASGFLVNHQKSKVLDIWKQPIEICGIGLKRGGRLYVPRHFMRKIQGMLFLSRTHQDINPKSIQGMMGAFKGLIGGRTMDKVERTLLRQYQAWHKETQS